MTDQDFVAPHSESDGAPSPKTQIVGGEKSIASLLRQKFQIDYYQRDYNWKTEQIEELIDDLTEKFFEYYSRGDERDAVEQYGEYFLGSVVISKKGGKRLIIDGQQRLTSLTLLLIYLDQLQKGIPEDQRVNITELIYSTRYGAPSFNLDMDERRACLSALIKGEVPSPTNETPSVQNMIEQFGEIENNFPDRLKNDALPYFIDWLIEKVVLIEITAPSSNDAYTIFETMNDRGLPLVPVEMLKGYLLSEIKDDGSRNLVESEWNMQMANLRKLGKTKEGEGANCIKAWLRSQYADKIRQRGQRAQPEDYDKLGPAFHRWIRENSEKIGLKTSSDFASFVTEKFKFYAHAYIKAHDAAENYTEELTSTYFNAQNGFNLQYPMMLAPLQLSDDEETIIRKMRLVTTFIEIMLARRVWNFKRISLGAMHYRAFLIMKGIRGMELEKLRDNLLFRLSPEGAKEEQEGGYIDFKSAEPFHLHGTNRTQVHHLLSRLTAFLEVQSGKPDRYPEYASRSRKHGYQIEHIWADHPERHEDEFDHPSEFRTNRNWIGGLVLLPASINASHSDKPYTEKVAYYAKENLLTSSLASITYQRNPGFRNFLEKSRLPFGAKETFRRADLDDRQNLYNDLADLCWSPDQLARI